MFPYHHGVAFPNRLFRFRGHQKHFLDEITRSAAPEAEIRFTCVDNFPDEYELRPELFPVSNVDWVNHLRWIFDGGNAHTYSKYVDDHEVKILLASGVNSYSAFPLGMVPRLVASLKKFATLFFKARRQHFAAACMVSDINNRKMWDDYGDRKRGIALEFDVNNPMSEIVDHLGEPMSFSFGSDSFSLFRMRYTNDIPLVSDLEVFRSAVNDPDDGGLAADNLLHACGAKDGLSIYERQFAFKGSSYEPENEWRLQRIVQKDQSGYYPSEIMKLKRVILGPRTEGEVTRGIVATCKELAIPVERISLSFDGDYRLFSILS
jgi:hypothetical protein